MSLTDTHRRAFLKYLAASPLCGALAGLDRALEILHAELQMTMEFAGTPTIDSIGPQLIGRH